MTPDRAAPRRRAPRGARAAVLAAGAAALLAGCAAVGPNFKPPPAPVSTTYAQVEDTPNPGPIETAVGEKVVSQWWTLYRSAWINDLVREAIANNRTLEAARARLVAAREAVDTDTGQLFANGTAGIKGQRANLSAAGFTPPPQFSFPSNPEFALYSIGGAMSYDFDLFGKVRRQREARLADAEAKARELDAAYLTLTGQVVIQAFTIGDATVHIAALKDIVANDQVGLDIVRKGFAAGGATAADVATAETQLAEDEAAIPPHKQRVAAARHQMAILLGHEPSQWGPPDFEIHMVSLPTHLPVALPSQLVHDRPDILEAEARLHASTARIGVATAALYPNVTLSASVNQDFLTPSKFFLPTSNSWALGPALTTPIFHSGELMAEKREAEALARADLAVYQQTVLAAFAQVDDSLQAIAHDNEAYDKLHEAMDGASRKMEMVRTAYKAGGASALQLVEAERTWRRTRLNLSDLGRSRFTDAARLLLATASVPPGVAEGAPDKPAPAAH